MQEPGDGGLVGFGVVVVVVRFLKKINLKKPLYFKFLFLHLRGVETVVGARMIVVPQSSGFSSDLSAQSLKPSHLAPKKSSVIFNFKLNSYHQTSANTGPIITPKC